MLATPLLPFDYTYFSLSCSGFSLVRLFFNPLDRPHGFFVLYVLMHTQVIPVSSRILRMALSHSPESWRLEVQLLVARASSDSLLFAELLSNGDHYARESGLSIPSDVRLHFYVPRDGLIPVDTVNDVYIPLHQSHIHVDRLVHQTLQSSAEREALQLNLNQTVTEQTEAQTTSTTTTAEVEVEVAVAAVVVI